MSQLELNRGSDSNASASPSTWPYTVGQVAVWAALLIFRRWLGAEFMGLRATGIIRSGPKAIPNTALEWFTLLHAHPLLGLILLNAFDMVNFVLAGLVFLALYAALRRTDRGFMTLALAFSFIGIAVYVATNPAFPMFTLSNLYAAATSDVQRSTLLLAGQTVLATKNPAALGQNLAFTFVHAAGLIASIVMLRSGIFSKVTAYLGILFNVFGLGYPLGIALASGSVVIPGAAWIVAVCFWVPWYIQIALTFRWLGRGGPDGTMHE